MGTNKSVIFGCYSNLINRCTSPSQQLTGLSSGSRLSFLLLLVLFPLLSFSSPHETSQRSVMLVFPFTQRASKKRCCLQVNLGSVRTTALNESKVYQRGFFCDFPSPLMPFLFPTENGSAWSRHKGALSSACRTWKKEALLNSLLTVEIRQ